MEKSLTNLKNRVNKIHLPKTKPLLPLFEVISNAIHAIEERLDKVNDQFEGTINITVLRNGDNSTLASLDNINNYPIHSFRVRDNGIGLNRENFSSFKEVDSEYKARIGGKGVGRLVCLKAFNKLLVESAYRENGELKYRSFEYKKTKEGFENHKEEVETSFDTSGTIITLFRYEDDFQKHVPLSLDEIAREIVAHFQLYFIQQKQPRIVIRNQNSQRIDLATLFNDEFSNEIMSQAFYVQETPFDIFISKSRKAKSHKIHYCGNERSVRDEGLSRIIVDLRTPVVDANVRESYYFQAFVVSDFLSNSVNEERTGFNFILEDNEDGIDIGEISLAKIRTKAVETIEELLKEFLTKVRKEKMEGYLPIIRKELPNYTTVINYNREAVEKLPAGLNTQELDIALYEIESDWKAKVKRSGLEIISKKKDITSLEQYKKLYEKFVAEFNEIGQSELARYIVHRRSVIDLLEDLIQWNEKNKFTDEDIIHSLFFPIRETGRTVTADKQNLWLLDERLTFNSLLASDKLFKQIDDLQSNSADRMDLIIRKDEVYHNAALYAENKTPFESFTIVEFKKPGRNDYVYGDPQKDPVFQVRRYIREIIDGKIKRNGRTIEVRQHTPFYCYIVADITNTLQHILKEEIFKPTPDGMGSFRFYDTDDYRAYVEVLPFEKVIKDAKQRNKVLFDKLNLVL
ncbi:MAG: ATP-binding protein [Chitinophaga sp.]|uniref:ATP-binding protein n=1 Tax=Chitinophaga sp. TaxID=1869181 RepID=UPI001B2F5838|nr:ATP-binding protein [Chitinophaga sp.]MBO9733200.1 ATP-binding protein [Chitinophaga sp.]